MLSSVGALGNVNMSLDVWGKEANKETGKRKWKKEAKTLCFLSLSPNLRKFHVH